MLEEKYMLRAIELAKKGAGWTNPNPLVGAVIVKDGRIIGEGWHHICGQLHAERDALKNVSEDPAGATIYVTLEPCCHHGKQPPCTAALIEAGIANVVIGSRDPNPKVAGGGVKALRDAGVNVIMDYMRDECDAINEVFFHFITTQTPFVTMKYAMTADGHIATETGKSKWISGELSRSEVHKMRHNHMAIMAGIGTVLADDPLLNCRAEVRGYEDEDVMVNGKNPIRIILDDHLRIPVDSQLVQTANNQPLIVATLPESENKESTNGFSDDDTTLKEKNIGDKCNKEKLLIEKGVQVLHISQDENTGCVDLNILMRELGKLQIDSILLEGGGMANASAIRSNIVSEIDVFMAPKMFGGGKSPLASLGIDEPSQTPKLYIKECRQVGDDLLIRYGVGNDEDVSDYEDVQSDKMSVQNNIGGAQCLQES
ncbi:MAG: bifunctional diaminohydroxyphosphoribosylaminopyrimidine deaminase/5-amino-6-(5-phosphoribosylamino)uracil reductase RibD [Butyrivibrio sp.]|nr:bifunctional diaminohydroxyphosphoribosylaminopyrimidine deaminase/5-amino-6-(5-phosphoribosylamino)uracil reductase RibD [Butyrivibrio sp.]